MIIRQQQLVIKKTKPSFIQVVICYLLMLMSATVHPEETEDPTVLYMNEVGLPFRTTLDRISTTTGYKIELVGTWPDGTVNTKMQDVPLDVGLKKIIKEQGVSNHAIIFDNEAKIIKIVGFQEGQEPDNTGNSHSTRDTGDAGTEIASGKTAETVTPPSPEGKPGLTRNQVAAIKAEYRMRLLSQTGDTEISPPMKYGPGMTIDDLHAIKKEYDGASQEQGSDTPVAPSSEYGNGMTAQELSRIKTAHERQIKLQGPETIILPPSEAGPGLTLGELNRIKQQHQNRPP